MKKEELIALGLTDEVSAKVLELVKTELAGNYVPKSRFDEVNEAKKNAEDLIKERNTQLEQLKASAGDSEKLKKQIEDLQAQNKQAEKEFQKSINQMKIDNAVEKAIGEKKGKNSIAIKALIADFLKDAKLDEDGTVKGLNEELDKLIADENSSFMFGKVDVKGFNPADGDKGIPTPDFTKMNYTELSKYLADNPDVKL